MKYTYQPDTTKFFASVRTSVFDGKLSQLQVDGINSVLEAFDGYDIRQLAYVLATVYHETAHTMQPVKEGGKGAGYDYGKKLKRGGGKGKRIPYTTPDKIYYGRGYIQVTWYENYEGLTKAAKKAGKNWDFLNNPELLLEDEPSIWAAQYGMTVGLYTGRKLSDYFNDKKTDPLGARDIINSGDRAALIATYYKWFLNGLMA